MEGRCPSTVTSTRGTAPQQPLTTGGVRGGRGKVRGGERRLRETAESLVEGSKRAARARFTVSRGQIREGGVLLVPGRDAGGTTDLVGDVVFQVTGDPGRGLTFLPEYQLEGEVSILVGIQEYSDENFMTPQGTVKQVPLCPDVHGLALSPTAGLMSLFHQVEVTYGGSYQDPLENLICGGANVAGKISALEASLGPLDPGGEEDEDRVSRPCFNREADWYRPPNNEWPLTNDGANEFRVYRSRIPRFPFRVLSPWLRARVQGTLGRRIDYPPCGIVPPGVDFRVLLRRETRVPTLMLLYPMRQGAKFPCGDAELDESDTSRWRQYTQESLDETTQTKKTRYFEVVTATPKIRRLSLVMRRIQMLGGENSWPPQIHTVYRTQGVELSKASTQVHQLAWDLPHPPATLFLCFLREEEVMGGGGGIGDTLPKLKKLLSTCPDNFYRPLKLEELRLVDNQDPTNTQIVEALGLQRMSRVYPDMSLRHYVEHLRCRT